MGFLQAASLIAKKALQGEEIETSASQCSGVSASNGRGVASAAFLASDKMGRLRLLKSNVSKHCRITSA